MRHLTLAGLVVAAAAAGTAGAATAQARPTEATAAARAVRAASIRAHLEFLADDALEGRAPATRGGDIAAKYLRAEFQRLGLEPAGDSGGYFHRVPIIALTPAPVLSVRTGEAAARELRYRDDYVLWSMHDEPSVRAAGDLVFVGYGIVAPEQGWNDYAGTDVKGKIVVALVNDPGLRDSTIFRGEILTYYGRWTYKLEEAERQGAAGILLIHTPESATYQWGTVASSWTGPQVRVARAAGPLAVAGWLTEQSAAAIVGGTDALARLTDAAGRKGFKAVSLNASATAAVSSTIRRSETHNVVARLPGRGPRAAEAVLIGGHYDHLGVGVPVNGDSIYNGAVDNASGTAAMLAAAEAMVAAGVKPARSILFMGFAAEESGLLGSTAFAARPTIPLRQIAAVLNVDVMNLGGRTRDVSALGTDQSSLGAVFTRAAAAEGLRVSVNQDALVRGSFFRSDHFPFARAGVPALSLEGGEEFVGKPAGYAAQLGEDYGNRRYHQPSDEVLPSFDYEGAVQQVRVIVRTALAVAASPGQPSYNPGSEFRKAGEARVARP